MSLQLGSEGNDVLQLQQSLRRLGADVPADGYYGLTTDRAVRVAQRKYGIVPPDGALGDDTIRAITAHDPDLRPDAFPDSGEAGALPFAQIGRSTFPS